MMKAHSNQHKYVSNKFEQENLNIHRKDSNGENIA